MNRICTLFIGTTLSFFIIGCQTTSKVVALSLTEQPTRLPEQPVLVTEQPAVDQRQQVSAAAQQPSTVPTPPRVVAPAEQIDPLTVYFTSDSSVLSERAQSALRALSYVILQNIASVKAIDVIGHTALAGTEEGREQTSSDRSQQVARYLVELGVPESFIEELSRGASQPVSTNDTGEGRALNRRADIVVEQK